MLHVARCKSDGKSYPSHLITHAAWHIYTPHATRHTSHVTRHTSFQVRSNVFALVAQNRGFSEDGYMKVIMECVSSPSSSHIITVVSIIIISGVVVIIIIIIIIIIIVIIIIIIINIIINIIIIIIIIITRRMQLVSAITWKLEAKVCNGGCGLVVRRVTCDV